MWFSIEVAFHLIAQRFSISRFQFRHYLFQPLISFTVRLLNIQELVWVSHEIKKFLLITIESFIGWLLSCVE
jgi:hypothetical protein